MSRNAIALMMGFLVAVAFGLTGCGGGGESSTVSISGIVADGYIKGAKVCLDLNENMQCDSGEPTATSTDGGAYTITGLTAAQTITFPIIAHVPVTAIDSDTNAAIGRQYILSSPPGKWAFVSPLTTLVHSEMKTSKVSPDIAEKTIKTQLGITNASLFTNYVEKKNSDSEYMTAANTAKVIASAMGQAKLDLGVAGATSLVTNYITDTIKANIPSLVTFIKDKAGNEEIKDTAIITKLVKDNLQSKFTQAGLQTALATAMPPSVGTGKPDTIRVLGLNRHNQNETLILRNSAFDFLTITSDGTYTFATPITNVARYTVVRAQPASQYCGPPTDTFDPHTGKLITTDTTDFICYEKNDCSIVSLGDAPSPTGLKVLNVTDTTVELDWNRQPWDHFYFVYYGTDSNVVYNNPLAQYQYQDLSLFPPKQVYYGLQPKTTYYFAVTSIYSSPSSLAACQSSASNTISVTTCNDSSQVWKNGVCVTPAPVCNSSQILQNGVCVTPAPVCTPPQIVQNGVCVTPAPVCTLPQMLQNGVCVTPAPVCTPTQILQNGICVTPATASNTLVFSPPLENGKSIFVTETALKYGTPNSNSYIMLDNNYSTSGGFTLWWNPKSMNDYTGYVTHDVVCEYDRNYNSVTSSNTEFLDCHTYGIGGMDLFNDKGTNEKDSNGNLVNPKAIQSCVLSGTIANNNYYRIKADGSYEGPFTIPRYVKCSDLGITFNKSAGTLTFSSTKLYDSLDTEPTFASSVTGTLNFVLP